MDKFNDLLNTHLQRAGLSDSELARAIGVSRQTVFRWREGLTARPRHRDDVLGIAKKLRLTEAERDTLLLAVGFRPASRPDDPETVVATISPNLSGVTDSPVPDSKSALPRDQAETSVMETASRMTRSQIGGDARSRLLRRYLPWIALVGAGLLILVLWGSFGRREGQPAAETGRRDSSWTEVNRQQIAPAEAGETLVLVAQLVR